MAGSSLSLCSEAGDRFLFKTDEITELGDIVLDAQKERRNQFFQRAIFLEHGTWNLQSYFLLKIFRFFMSLYCNLMIQIRNSP